MNYLWLFLGVIIGILLIVLFILIVVMIASSRTDLIQETVSNRLEGIAETTFSSEGIQFLFNCVNS